MTDPYGWAHQQLRKWWDRWMVANGPWTCRRCGRPVYPDRQRELNVDGRKFHLGHGISVIAGGQGEDCEPEHDKCNTRAGQHEGAARRREPASQEW